MKLKRLEMEGFKSFCDKTVLEFHEGITAIVGPNGTGKSNILDSIRWVLGEQSAKALRGQEMADVIFHGAAGRRASGMAEVSLTFSDCETVLGTDYHEVQITRRVFRDGVSEYAINGANCRLKDIQRLFLDTGIGRAAYSIMEQGKIDQILSSRPEDRRAIFEEAAGVMRFKVQKREAERKLEGTEANLLRLADILREVRRQMGSLQRQAGKARRYREIFDKLKKLDLALSARERDRLLLKIDELSNLQAKTKADLERAHATEAACEQAVRGQRNKLEEADRAWRDAEREVVSAKAEEVRCAERARMQTERAEELGAAIERARGEIALADRQTAAQEELIRSLRAELESVTAEFQKAEQACAEVQEQANQARSRREAASGKVESVRGRRESARREADTARARAAAEEVTTRQRAEILERVRQELSEKESEISRERASLEALTGRLREAEERLPQAQARTRETEGGLRSSEEYLSQAEKEKSSAEAERTLAESKLEAVRERAAGDAEACLKAWTATGRNGAYALWPSLKIREGYETAVAMALGPLLDGVMVDDLEAMAHTLESGEDGPAGFLISKTPAGGGAESWPEGACNFIESAGGWEPVLQNLLAGTCIAESWEQARELSRQRPVATVICRDGRMISGRGWQRRGKVRSSRPGRNEVESAKEKLSRAQQAATEAGQKTGMARQEVERFQGELASARQGEESARKSLEEVRRDHDRREALHQALLAEISRRQTEASRLEQEIVLHQKIAAEKASESERLMALEQGMEAEMAEAEEVRRSAENEETKLQELLTERRVEKSGRQQRKDSCAAALTPAEARLTELRELVTKRNSEISMDTARMEAARTEAETATRAEGEALKRAQEIEASTSGLKQARENEAQVLTQKEEEVTHWRKEGEKAKDALATLALRGSELEHQKQSLADRLQREYATGLMDAKAEGEIAPQTEEGWIQLETEAKELREKVEDMGPVNTEAISEYEELEQRLKFLETEELDLTTAKAQLEEAIKKINQTTRLLFEETFDKVKANFGNLFAELFGGGRATIKLTEGEDLLEGGIEIEAQPPGKQPKVISLLSGGEKTMTALALLLAIYAVKPSPFCVLDEMDAPLDESNTVRFVQIIERFVEKSQFLVITHNKRTMSAADLLYGVTAPEPGCSRMMSVKLTRDEETPLFAQAGT
ncbi:MAG: chromosome segregation protein SMC [Verrucomicrobia bacterium]|nr:chromosome segregation protein SMC [Verrucomicrobiota bacterium]